MTSKLPISAKQIRDILHGDEGKFGYLFPYRKKRSGR